MIKYNDTYMDNWLPKLKDKLRNDLRQLDSLPKKWAELLKSVQMRKHLDLR